MEILQNLLGKIELARLTTVPALVCYAAAFLVIVLILVRRGKKLSGIRKLVNLKVKLEHGPNAVLAPKAMRKLTAKFRRGTRLRVYAVLLVTLTLVYFALPMIPGLPGAADFPTFAAIQSAPTSALENGEAVNPDGMNMQTEESETSTSDPEMEIYNRILEEEKAESRNKQLQKAVQDRIVLLIIIGILLILTIITRGVPRIWLGVACFILVAAVGVGFTGTVMDSEMPPTGAMIDHAYQCYDEGRYADAYACTSVLLREKTSESQNPNENEMSRIVLLKALSEAAMHDGIARNDREQTNNTKKLFEYALDLFEKGDYTAAEILWREMRDAGYPKAFVKNQKDLFYTRHDLLNNYALAELELGHNEEALAIMRQIFEEGTNEVKYIINLLVAAQANEIHASAILSETGADTALANWLSSAYLQKKPGDRQKMQTAIGYNIAWMDMELPREEFGQAVPVAQTIYMESDERYGQENSFDSKKALLQETKQMLQYLNTDEKNLYGEPDPDVSALVIYLTALMDGGESVPVSGTAGAAL